MNETQHDKTPASALAEMDRYQNAQNAVEFPGDPLPTSSAGIRARKAALLEGRLTIDHGAPEQPVVEPTPEADPVVDLAGDVETSEAAG